MEVSFILWVVQCRCHEYSLFDAWIEFGPYMCIDDGYLCEVLSSTEFNNTKSYGVTSR
jgi:hypothetical protein